MKAIAAFLLLLAGSLAELRSALAQEHQHAAGDAQELGQVEFTTSCRADVQPDFDRAVAMLHSFWYPEAEKAFADIAGRDPGCAMAYWGVAMSRLHPLWQPPGPEDLAAGQAALAKARAAGSGTPRERDYIDALGKFYDDAGGSDHLVRMRAYEAAMAGLVRRHSEDPEAAIFHALALLGVAAASPPDGALARQKEAGTILQARFAGQPDHPGIAHYIIHSYDYPELAEGALEAARRYAEIAPSAPHALHMPSHIFTRLGLWQESIESNRAAAAAARASAWTGEELHATDYLVYAYLQEARDGEAREAVDRLPALAGELTPDAPAYVPQGIFAMAAIPARYAVERGEWREAAALSAQPGLLPGGSLCWAEASLHFARGLGAARLGEIQGARSSAEWLTACARTLREAGDERWARHTDVQRQAVEGWTAMAKGDSAAALAAMREAADLEDATDKHPVTPGAIIPARELLGEMLLELGRPGEALAEFEASLRAAPNRYRAIFGAGRAAAASGNSAGALGYYSTLLEITARADTERPGILEAEESLRQAATASSGGP
ncbi:MAG TPA: hypothetical protein VFP98_01830 [Candidatus Polarisedimenticolia bacterium]|nr:hypothetical protein [Candidatus Polarisedimenticolia bacterium]